MTDEIGAPAGAASDNPASREQYAPTGAVESSGNVFADLGFASPGVEQRLADAHIAGLPMPIARALAELVGVAIESIGEREPQLVTALDNAIAAIMGAVIPAEMTPAIAEVLGLMLMDTVPAAHLFRAAGAEIRTRVEEEQAFVLFRFVHLALQHGEGWAREADRLLAKARAAVQAKLPAAGAP